MSNRYQQHEVNETCNIKYQISIIVFWTTWGQEREKLPFKQLYSNPHFHDRILQVHLLISNILVMNLSTLTLNKYLGPVHTFWLNRFRLDTKIQFKIHHRLVQCIKEWYHSFCTSGAPRPALVWRPPNRVRRRLGAVWRRADAGCRSWGKAAKDRGRTG